MAVTEPVEQMKAVFYTMSRSLMEGRVLKYRLHLGVNMHLKDKQKQLIRNTMDRLVPGGILDYKNPKFLVSYEECLRLMKELDAELDTDIFSRTMKGTFIFKEMTYQEAMEEFKKMEKEELATGEDEFWRNRPFKAGFPPFHLSCQTFSFLRTCFSADFHGNAHCKVKQRQF